MKIRICAFVCWVVGLMCGCSDFTEVNPKGKNTLNKVEDLGLLLNYDYDYVSLSELSELVNDVYLQYTNHRTLLEEQIKTLEGISVTWDEKTDRAELTQSDTKYEELYKVIGQVANPLLTNVDRASGDRALANQYKAEALVLRAWCHYLLVNIYAKAYDPLTAVTDPGIIYTLETDNMAVPKEKSTVEQVYRYILDDLNAALALNSLPASPNPMRVGKAFAYAAKAKVSMSMRDYDAAFDAAEESLKVKSTIDDYNDRIDVGQTAQQYANPDLKELFRNYLTCEEELFETPQKFFFTPFSPELWADVEDNHIYKSYMLTDENPLLPDAAQGQGDEKFGVHVPYIMNDALYYSPMSLTTVDMRLVKAECYIRKNQVGKAMDELNLIREKRMVRGKYVAETASTVEEAFTWLKKVSRLENFYTAKTFINLKRWNTEEKYRETLHKTYRWTEVLERDAAGNPSRTEEREKSYELSPDSPLWIYPFPQNATNLNPHLTQNY